MTFNFNFFSIECSRRMAQKRNFKATAINMNRKKTSTYIFFYISQINMLIYTKITVHILNCVFIWLLAPHT